MLSLCNLFARASLSVSNKTTVGNIARNVSTSNTLLINLTPCLYAEPLKKRKRLDPSVIRARDERRKRKLSKLIRRREKLSLNLKPVEELLIPHKLLEEKSRRSRQLPQLSQEVLDERTRVMKTWTKYRHSQELANTLMLDRIVCSQQKALDELRLESEQLYQEAIKMDSKLLPFTTEGPTVTPKIEGYESPDGDYVDVSFKWE